jgi:cytochrome c peroxidase
MLAGIAFSAGLPVPPEMRLEALPARAPEPEENPATPAKIALGRLLFFDPILSATKDVACATCHHPRFGWGDGRATPIGANGGGLGLERKFLAVNPRALLLRNAPTLLNVGFNGLVAGVRHDAGAAPMFWDARVQSLEKQVVVPIRSRDEMRGDGCSEAEAIGQAVGRVRAIAEYRDRFSQAFGQPQDEAVTAVHLAQAIAVFERSLVTPGTPFDRFLGGEKSALNAEQQRGLRVFQDAGCIHCHGGPMLSDFKLHFIGVTDGTADGRREFRTPTLRNLGHTAPYMHNGSLRTLRDVLVFYEALSDAVAETLDGGDTTTQPRLDPLLKPLNLNTDDFPALEAFLASLNADRYDQSVPVKVPSGLPVQK